MSDVIEIYGLYDPDSGALRYVGKAKNSNERLKRHIGERNKGRPVNNWIRKMLADGKTPRVEVLEIVPIEQWEDAERRLIAHYRLTCDLLNLADGGAMPKPTIEQRQNSARAAYKAIATKHHGMLAVHKSRMEISKLHKNFLRKGDYKYAAKMRFLMRIWAADKPELYGCWAAL